MFNASGSLPHLLAPSAYWDDAYGQLERERLLTGSWHLVATWSDLALHGAFVTCELLGTPLIVRNFSGELRAFLNVCAHRHCRLTDASSGTAPTLRCQYHGWEYGEDGRTRHIPAPKNFVPFDREAHRLGTIRVARCGQLVFVNLASDGPELAEHMGDFYELCESRFGDGWSQTLHWNPDYAANWKVVIENSLEAYHVPYIHPQTFGQDPGPERSTHVLKGHRTAFGTQLPFSPHSAIDRWFQQGEGWFLRRLGVSPTGEYWQHHVFPNLLFSFTDALSLCHCVLPNGSRAARGIVRQFGRMPASGQGGRAWLARGWGRIAAAITRRIVQEDMGLFGEVQRGLEASPHAGLLGACEERLHAFQKYLVPICGPGPSEPDEGADRSARQPPAMRN